MPIRMNLTYFALVAKWSVPVSNVSIVFFSFFSFHSIRPSRFLDGKKKHNKTHRNTFLKSLYKIQRLHNIVYRQATSQGASSIGNWLSESFSLSLLSLKKKSISLGRKIIRIGQLNNFDQIRRILWYKKNYIWIFELVINCFFIWHSWNLNGKYFM